MTKKKNRLWVYLVLAILGIGVSLGYYNKDNIVKYFLKKGIEKKVKDKAVDELDNFLRNR